MFKEDLKKMSSQELAVRLKDGESALFAAGLLKEFLKARILSLLIILLYRNMVGKTPDGNRTTKRQFIRVKILKVLQKFTPCAYPSGKDVVWFGSSIPTVVGFNHSSSGDIFRVLFFTINKCPDKMIVLPVNITIYEAFASVARELEVGGIYLCPIISYGLYDKIKNDKNHFLLRRLRINLETRYHIMVNECVKKNGVAIVPLDFDKRPTIFKTVAEAKGKDDTSLNLSITKIARYLRKHKRVHYVAMSVEPKTRKSGLNLGKVYTIEYSGFYPENIKELLSAPNRYKLEYSFLRRIANKLSFDRWHPKED